MCLRIGSWQILYKRLNWASDTIIQRVTSGFVRRRDTIIIPRKAVIRSINMGRITFNWCGKQDAQPSWIQESVDLTPYAGQKVMVKFQQITDEVYTAPGFAIDNIEIPEIGFSDDVENGDNGWVAKGFVRFDNILPQHFIV